MRSSPRELVFSEERRTEDVVEVAVAEELRLGDGGDSDTAARAARLQVADLPVRNTDYRSRPPCRPQTPIIAHVRRVTPTLGGFTRRKVLMVPFYLTAETAIIAAITNENCVILYDCVVGLSLCYISRLLLHNRGRFHEALGLAPY